MDVIAMAEHFLVPAPMAGDQDKFLAWDETTSRPVWAEPAKNKLFLASNEQWIKGNTINQFLCGNGNWTKMELGPQEAQTVYVYAWNPTLSDGQSVVIEHTYFVFSSRPNLKPEEVDASRFAGQEYTWTVPAGTKYTYKSPPPWKKCGNTTPGIIILDPIYPENLDYWFSGLSLFGTDGLLYTEGLDLIDMQFATSMFAVFDYSGKTTLQDVSQLAEWDVSNITDMAYAFEWQTAVTNYRLLDNWDVSKVTNKTYAFYNVDYNKRPIWAQTAEWGGKEITGSEVPDIN